MTTKIATDKAPAAIGPYSQGVSIDGLVFTSGQIPVDPATGLVPETIEEQAARSLSNVKAVLEAAGTSCDKVIKTTVFLSDIGDFGKVNEIYARYFTGPILPARSCVQVAALPKGVKIEIEAIAVK